MSYGDIIQAAMWCALAYVAGSINFSIIVSGLSKKGDVRNFHSKNAGATNTYRLLGWRWAIVVLVLDIGRGAFAARLAGSHFGVSWISMLVCFCLLIGNVLPAFHRFRGGKGVATSLGLIFGINPYCALVSWIVWIFVVAVIGRASIGSLLAVAVFPLMMILLNSPNEHLAFGVAMFVIVVITHRANIVRILQGKEPTISK